MFEMFSRDHAHRDTRRKQPGVETLEGRELLTAGAGLSWNSIRSSYSLATGYQLQATVSPNGQQLTVQVFQCNSPVSKVMSVSNLPPGNTVTDPAASIDRNGNFVVAWVQKSNNLSQIVYEFGNKPTSQPAWNLLGTHSLTGPVQSPTVVTMPDVIIDKTNSLDIVYDETYTSGKVSNSRIIDDYFSSTSSAAAANPPRPVSQTVASVSGPAQVFYNSFLDPDSSDNLHVDYDEYSSKGVLIGKGTASVTGHVY